ncbi:Cu(I)-responsive transcriptional regulator [Endozoicomonas sp. Mp262]|uniref:Cu(I)-responsive transcriptional regulator n=1 Tax=Endozoicomonas sp. Mp262 TaxID=2919499 RepID=UPI0021D87A5E
MNISKAAEATGLTPKTIRYYESIQLITPACRQQNGYREYSRDNLKELAFINQARKLGFTLKECAELMNLYKDKGRKSSDVKALTMKKIEDIEKKITQLQSIRDSLQLMTECCHGDELPECPIIDCLAKAH